MQAIAPLTIGELARLSGTDVPSIRSYEEMGLLPKPRRRRGRTGDFAYHQEHLDRVTFIRRGLEVGFSLEAIAGLLGTSGGLVTCNDAYRIAGRQLASTRKRITDLQRQEKALEGLVEACAGVGPRSDCVILRTLDRAPAPQGDCCQGREGQEKLPSGRGLGSSSAADF